MSEPNNRELNEKIADIREWLVRIDTKVDFFNDVKHTADRAEQKADKALLKTDDNTADLADLKQYVDKRVDGLSTTTKWAIGLAVPSIISIVALIVTIAF